MKLPQSLLSQMIEHAQREFPKEACGILTGQGDTVTKVYTLTNIVHNPDGCGWQADPREQYDAFMEMEAWGWQLLGIYHSHPNTPPEPSAQDVAAAVYSEPLYFIISLLDQQQPEFRAFYIQDGQAKEHMIDILP